MKTTVALLRFAAKRLEEAANDCRNVANEAPTQSNADGWNSAAKNHIALAKQLREHADEIE